MNWIIENLPVWNSWLAIWLYWWPVAVCLFCYSIRMAEVYRADLAARAKAERVNTESGGYAVYTPTLTVGWIVLRLLASYLPVVNLLAAVFSLAPRLVAAIFERALMFLDIPLVPKR